MYTVGKPIFVSEFREDSARQHDSKQNLRSRASVLDVLTDLDSAM